MKLTLRIESDNDPVNPRDDYDHLGTMVCWHKNYKLGDEQPYIEPAEYLRELGGFKEDSFWTNKQFENAEKAARSRVGREYIMLDLYLYDHSGITISTSSFNDRWDSGQVGFIYVSISDVKKEYGWKNLTKSRREKIIGYLKGEVKEYDQYLTGDVWGFIIEDENGEHLDSCWGFYGEEHCQEAGKEALEYETELIKKRKLELELLEEKLQIQLFSDLLHAV